MKNLLIVCTIFCSLNTFAQTGLYTMQDGSDLIITPLYAPDFRYRKTDGASGRLFLQADSSYISAPGWAEKNSDSLYGELFLPVAKPKSVVILQFGSGKESAVANNYVQYLLPGDDIAVFVFDKRGTGRG